MFKELYNGLKLVLSLCNQVDLTSPEARQGNSVSLSPMVTKLVPNFSVKFRYLALQNRAFAASTIIDTKFQVRILWSTARWQAQRQTFAISLFFWILSCGQFVLMHSYKCLSFIVKVRFRWLPTLVYSTEVWGKELRMSRLCWLWQNIFWATNSSCLRVRRNVGM